MALTIFGRFHAREGQAQALAAAIAWVVPQTRAEPACLAIDGYRSIRDPRLFHIHSVWTDEAAFEVHAGLPHTVAFLDRVRPLIDHDLAVDRAVPLTDRPA